ncbi:hypothetical protein BB558_006962 [Smittium angustum]|uniref:Uncharacterized protein n=1 Tax=Smittium angustum TaxID=133377 RepID=A0A2U1IWD2_SMIAN|nr:hypothetical protein BB558_006962 [Smittium angustum]
MFDLHRYFRFSKVEKTATISAVSSFRFEYIKNESPLNVLNISSAVWLISSNVFGPSGKALFLVLAAVLIYDLLLEDTHSSPSVSEFTRFDTSADVDASDIMAASLNWLVFSFTLTKSTLKCSYD